MGALNPAVRFRILARDDFTCQYCGRRAPTVVLEVDHVQPRSNGGSNAWTNLVTACQDCNRGKSDALLTPAQVQAFTRGAPAPEPRRMPKRPRPVAGVMLPVYRDGAFLGRRRFDAVPIASSFVYTENGELIGQFICCECGFYNGFEDDHCGCRKRAEERFSARATPGPYVCECGEEAEEGEELCASCFDGLYVRCWYCGENDQVRGSNYCASCSKQFEVV